VHIDSILYEDQKLTVRCSGEFGEGSQGQPSADLLNACLSRWMDDHTENRVGVIEVDLRDVDYCWGDGPLSSTVSFVLRRGVSLIRLVASAGNAQSVRDLVEWSKLPWFTVVDGDA
jgi:hypothetical protein